ncbi:endonuclease/exonuclease/phosphatase family protein [Flavivirga sp. 57AJ16]|uniref:endonuclease/exonuclease/phosphatase family protein n=1 Tax=Flavivirga sp. 57AJ16 TaxID=3025307 RepID=UPI002365174E|nr:endonuclease/exonuclease/phosphatase family protein [Flavivirga sp. 57AJ16]MDD7886272.1 T9SS type A sorting domain-containing protein [Flavivirga sp. 57AJ16]
MKKTILLLSLVLSTVTTSAQLLSWQFGDPISSGDEGSYAPTHVNPHITANPLTRGSGILPIGLSRGFSSSDFTINGTMSDAINNNDYYEVSFSVQPGYTVSLYNIDAKLRRSSSGASFYRWMYSLDGTTFLNANTTDVPFDPTDTNGAYQTEVMLSNIDALQNLSFGTTITLRLYLWGATTSTSTVAFGRFSSGDTSPSLSIGGRVVRNGDESLIGFQFALPNSSGNEESYPSTSNNLGVYSSTLNRGSGIPEDSNTGLSRGFTARNFLPLNGTKSDALTNSNYYEFALSPKEGSTASLTSLNVRLRRSNSGCNAYRWSYSLDGVNFTDMGTGNVPFTSGYDGIDQPEIDLGSIAALQNLTYGTTVTFRLYAWGNTTDTGTFAIGRHVSGAVVNSLEVHGGISQTITPQFNAGTYNVRYANTIDALDLWETRYPHIANLIKNHNMDIFGVQEISYNMSNELMPLLPEHTLIGETTEGGTDGYYSPIVYNVERFTLHDTGTFWLSETPDVISYGWDAQHIRICTWGEFTDNISGLHFYFFNTHLDHVGVVAREEGVNLIFNKMNTMACDDPVIFTGDLNIDQFDSLYIDINNNGIVKNAYDLAHNQINPYQGTFNSFNVNKLDDVERIDHIFLTNHFKANTYEVYTDTYNGDHFPSDHFAVNTNVQARQTDKGELYWEFPEDFENATAPKTLYAAGNVTLQTGAWLFEETVLQNTANDRPSSGVYAGRMRGSNTAPSYLEMLFDVPHGASKVVVWYSSYGASGDVPSEWILEYSTDQGSTWSQIGDTISAIEKTKKQAVFLTDIQGNVRFRINKVGLEATTIGRLSIDDISIFRSETTLGCCASQTTEMQETSNVESFKVLSNDEQTSLLFEANANNKATVYIYDLSGLLKFKQNIEVFSGSNMYPIRKSLSPGLYIAKFQYLNKTETVKFIKK